jgi:hypothetical protein
MKKLPSNSKFWRWKWYNELWGSKKYLPTPIYNHVPNFLFYFFIFVIQLMVDYHKRFDLMFQELWVRFKMCMDYDKWWNTSLKVFQRPKYGHLVFIFLLLASYNNVYYTHESFFIHLFINWI